MKVNDYVVLHPQVAVATRQRRRGTRDHTDVGYTPNLMPTAPKRQRKPKYPYTPGN